LFKSFKIAKASD
jgi:uncharacterized membrane protein